MKRKMVTALFLSAALCILSSVPALAAGMYVAGPSAAPGVQGTGASQSPSAGQAAIVSSPDASEPIRILNSANPGPGVGISPDGASIAQGAQNAGTASAGTAAPQVQQAAEQESELLARSLREPYTLFPTSDPNVFISRGRKVDRTKPMIALTYDDGPQTEAGGRILNAFQARGQRATFFMVGDRVASRASEVKRMADEGHEVANHTWDHTLLNGKSAETVRTQIAKCNTAVANAAGITPRLMRLPGGSGASSSTVVGNVGMPIILWNIDTRDWEHRNAQKTINAVVGKVKDGDVVLMHELYGATATATESIVPSLVDQGFQLVTVSEMAALKGITLNNRVYYSF